MKVKSWNEDGPFEITEEDRVIEKMVTAIKCPICKVLAYFTEPELYICSSCGLGWSFD